MELEKEIAQEKFKNAYHKLAVNLIYTSSWLRSFIFRQLKPRALSPEQFNILRILRGQHPHPVTINLLIERMLDKMSNASRLVEKLRRKGLVKRQFNQADRRSVDVRILPKGLSLLKKLDRVENGWFEKLKTISIAEAKRANQILDKLRGS